MYIREGETRNGFLVYSKEKGNKTIINTVGVGSGKN